MPTSIYTFQEIAQNFTPLSACQFTLDDDLVVEMASDILTQSAPVSIGKITTLYHNEMRYYMFFLSKDSNQNQILSPVMPDYDPSLPYLGSLTPQAIDGYPNQGGSIKYTYLTVTLDSLLTSFMSPSIIVEETSTDGSLTATLVMIPEGTLLDPSMNIMKNLYPDTFAAYTALSSSTAGVAGALSGNVSTYTFQDLGTTMEQDVSAYRFILDNSLIIPVTNGMLASPSIGIYYSSMIIYNNVRYFLFALKPTTNVLMPLMIDLDPSKPANSFLAPEPLNDYPNIGGSVALLYRSLDPASLSGGAAQIVNVITTLPDAGGTYTSPIVAIAEYILLTPSNPILGSVYPELLTALKSFEKVEFDVDQHSPDPTAVIASINSSSRIHRTKRNLNLAYFLITISIVLGIGYLLYTREHSSKESPRPSSSDMNTNAVMI